LTNNDIEDLYSRVTVGTKVVVYPGKPSPETAASMGNWCATPVGVYPGPFHPVGSQCLANTRYGRYIGNVVQR
jgi:hypothetical protein